MANNYLIPTLNALGLSKEEALTYISLIESGASNVSSLSRKLSLSRVTTYSLINNLINKDCIAKTKYNKRILYQAHDPELLLSRFEKIYKEGSQALSALSVAQHKSLFIPDIQVYSGGKEITKIFDDVGMTIPRGGTYFRYTSRTKDQERSPLYSRLRIEKEIERLVITNEKKSLSKEKDSNRFIKTVPKDFAFDDNVTVLIYANKIAHIDFNSDVAIVIDSPQLARFQEKIFKLLWKKL